MARLIARAVQSPYRPILAQIVPTRRCNLACTYCNEFDHASEPVAIDVLLRRIDRLAALGTLSVDLSGGEPLLHPGIDDAVRQIRSHGMFAGLLTNGYLLSRERIRRLNRAGLDRLQISVDNVIPDDVSKKSLRVLDSKLRMLAEHAEFDVSINSVLGSGVRNPGDALTIARRALELGLGTSVGLIHDGSGQLVRLDAAQRAVYREISSLGRGFYTHPHDALFQQHLVDGIEHPWNCRAGARYLYVCEDGLVHWCSQQRGYPGIPLDGYTLEDLRREHGAPKWCAPSCTVSCVRRVSLIDDLRERPLDTINALMRAEEARGRRPPRSVHALRWLFVTGPLSGALRQLAGRCTAPSDPAAGETRAR